MGRGSDQAEGLAGLGIGAYPKPIYSNSWGLIGFADEDLPDLLRLHVQRTQARLQRKHPAARQAATLNHPHSELTFVFVILGVEGWREVLGLIRVLI